MVADFSWFKDELSQDEASAVRSLAVLSRIDSALAKRVAALPWLADGISRNEAGQLHELRQLAEEDLEAARAMADTL